MFLFDDISFVQTQDLPLSELWYFLPFGYLVTILIETPILLAGLGSKFTFKQKLLSGIWLTACTYPIVVIVLPALFQGSPRGLYLTVAEIFAPVAECAIFWLAFRGTEAVSWTRSFAVIIVANLASFGLGEVLNAYNWLGLF
ncbi:MAG: hypothetical protein K1X52_04915 [Pyrinomonadaceae bacterium]|mgnify:CR=1 FL=1|nr:hypothetical protein [Pyrinomonadaceae bacterium]